MRNAILVIKILAAKTFTTTTMGLLHQQELEQEQERAAPTRRGQMDEMDATARVIRVYGGVIPRILMAGACRQQQQK